MKAARLHAPKDPASRRYEDVLGPRLATATCCFGFMPPGLTPTELLWPPTSFTRSGEARPLPLTLGHEFSGEVVELGSNVTGLSRGEPRPTGVGACDFVEGGARAARGGRKGGTRPPTMRLPHPTGPRPHGPGPSH